jgi:hypothetical protein
VSRQGLQLSPRKNGNGLPSGFGKGNGRSSPGDILIEIAKPAGLEPTDFPPILSRYERFLKTDKTRRYPKTRRNLILATAYEYLRWEGSMRQPKSPNEFLKMCDHAGFKLNRSQLFIACTLLIDANIFPRTQLTPRQLLEKKWPRLSSDLALPPEVETLSGELISSAGLEGRAPETVVAAAVYVAARMHGEDPGYRYIASALGVTDVAVRGVVQQLLKRLSPAPTIPTR